MGEKETKVCIGKVWNQRHLRNIDCLTACTACLVCFISTVNGRSKKKKEKKPITSGASSRHITKLKQSIILRCLCMEHIHHLPPHLKKTCLWFSPCFYLPWYLSPQAAYEDVYGSHLVFTYLGFFLTKFQASNVPVTYSHFLWQARL